MSNSAADTADTTAPTLVERPRDGHAANGPLVFTFSEAIKLGPDASIRVYPGTKAGITIALTDNPAVTLVGSILTVQLPQQLDYAASYTAQFSAGAVADLSGNPVSGGSSFNVRFVSGLSPVALNLTGTSGNDTLNGSDLADTIDGGAGADTIHGHGGNDLLYGGADAGWDEINGGAGNDGLWGGGGNDRLNGGNGNDELYGEAGNDRLNGDDGDDLLEGGAGDDQLNGGAGANTLRGGDGNDGLTVLAGSVCEGGAGDDEFWISFNQQSSGVTELSGDSGNDRFHLGLQPSSAGKTTVSGGAGTDSYVLTTSDGASFPDITVTDFTPGAGGDLIDVRSMVVVARDGNPFDSGLRLLASGSDTLLQQRSLATGNWVTVLTVAGLMPSQLLAANFVESFNPLGGTVGPTFTGTAGDDILGGTRLDDTLIGLGGADVLLGGEGDDVLDGGDGDDTLDGQMGDDILRGGNGDDILSTGFAGNDVLEGGAGNDSLTTYGRGDATLSGGDGNDTLTIFQSSPLVGGTSFTLDGGAGNDTFDFRSMAYDTDVVASGGEGADVYRFSFLSNSTAVRILDFGATDQLDLRERLPNEVAANPFGTGGYVKAVQLGADVGIFIDWDGAAGSMQSYQYITLANLSLASLSLANFVGGIDPGSTGSTLTGTSRDEILTGTSLNDTIDGRGGADRIDGAAGDDLLLGGDESVAGSGDEIDGGDGNDSLHGGSGNDRLRGGAGKDSLHGDAGDDILDGGEGDDLLEGGDGNDTLDDISGNNELYGGAGDDTLGSGLGAPGSSTLDGGAGNDLLWAGPNAGTVRGGSGDDHIHILPMPGNTPIGALRAEGGEGNDRFTVSAQWNTLRDIVLSGGAGADRYVFQQDTAGAFTITDFQAGSSGDLIDLSIPLPDVAGNPFTSGHVRLLQDGTRVLLQVDRHGAAGPLGFETRVIFENLSVSSLTSHNFTEGLHPDGSTGGMELAGGDGADRLDGGRLDDTLRGNGGADVLAGKGGSDTLLGGAGNDSLDGGAGNDRLEGGAGQDQLVDKEGNNSLYGGDDDDRLETGESGSNQVFGEAGNDYLIAAGSGTFEGGAGNDRIEFYALGLDNQPGTALIRGGDGADVISFGTNRAGFGISVVGGGGSDVFKPKSIGRDGPMVVTDFAVGGGGDVLDVSELGNAQSANPFAPGGHLQLVQRGGDTVLQLRADGVWYDSVLLQNVAMAALSAVNFVSGYAPVPAGDLVLNGSVGADILRGGDGNDTLFGLDGADQLAGDGGNDFLVGGAGNDRLDGGAGNDVLQGEAGDDELLGGAGDDNMEDRLGNNILRGGEGNDYIHTGATGSAQVFGEAGNDMLFIAGSGRFDGGEGHDGFYISLDSAATGSLLLTGGAGRDSYRSDSASFGATVTITDFVAGAGGDFINLSKLVTPTSGNPFLPGGSLQLVQRGADAVLQTRLTANGASSFQDVFILRGVSADALSSENLVYEFGNNNGILYRGSDGNDNFTGSEHDDILRGNEGDDVLTGRTGNDHLEGGSGNDRLHGGSGNDLLAGGSGIDTAMFSGARADYGIGSPSLTGSANVVDRRGGVNDGNDTLVNVERLMFADGAIALDTGATGIAGQAYRIYRAAFDRPADEGGLGFWISRMDGGSTLTEIAGGFVRSQEFIDLYGAAPTHAEIVTRMYTNILDRAPEKAGYDYWLAALDSKMVDVATMLGMFSESNENYTAVAQLIANGVAYQPFGG